MLLQARGSGFGAGVVVLVVADRHVADKPSVHVHAAGLGDDALRSLYRSVSIPFGSVCVGIVKRTYPVQILVLQLVLRELPPALLVLHQQV